MMKLNMRLGNFTLEVEGENLKEIIKSVSQSGAPEFMGQVCGICGCEDVLPQHRVSSDPKNTNKKYDYYEMVCQNPKCRAKLGLGQKTDLVGLFPKKKEEDGTWLPSGGWEKYVKPTE